MSTYKGLLQLGFKPDEDFELWGDGEVITIAKWFSSTPQPSDSEIKAAAVTWQANYDSQEYARKRKEEYPSIGDQLDMIYHNGDGGAEFQAAIKAVKDKYPKE